ncbi:hypothetical protein BGW80DRAFT_298455 [Lactifluus volemus]|nr:hypothetical protein BGW80DRAFT_298455 [Lactifluus volemus]
MCLYLLRPSSSVRVDGLTDLVTCATFTHCSTRSTAKKCHFTSNSLQLCLMVITLVPPFPPDPSCQTLMTLRSFKFQTDFFFFSWIHRPSRTRVGRSCPLVRCAHDYQPDCGDCFERQFQAPHHRLFRAYRALVDLLRISLFWDALISNTVIQYVIHCHVELFQTRRSTAPPVLIEDD